MTFPSLDLGRGSMKHRELRSKLLVHSFISRLSLAPFPNSKEGKVTSSLQFCNVLHCRKWFSDLVSLSAATGTQPFCRIWETAPQAISPWHKATWLGGEAQKREKTHTLFYCLKFLHPFFLRTHLMLKHVFYFGTSSANYLRTDYTGNQPLT